MADSGLENVSVLINGSRIVPARRGISLLKALKGNGIFIPSACGGRGACGLCRLRVQEGATSALTPAELNHLSADEQRDKFRLACQVVLSGVLRVTIPESYFSAHEFRAEVTEKRNLTNDIIEIRLKLLNPPSIAFKSGQYIQLRIPPYEESKRSCYRAYSIASPPSENTMLELQIRRVHKGLGTTYLFEHLQPADAVAFNGPHGDFFLRDSGNDIVMIAGGSGMAPMKSMLADMRNRGLRRKTRFFFGARTPHDVFYADLMRQFEQTLFDFKFIPAISSLSPEDHWEGETGLIPEVVARHLDTGFGGEAYLCGSPAMLEACLDVFKRKNISEERIYYDKFA